MSNMQLSAILHLGEFFLSIQVKIFSLKCILFSVLISKLKALFGKLSYFLYPVLNIQTSVSTNYPFNMLTYNRYKERH